MFRGSQLYAPFYVPFVLFHLINGFLITSMKKGKFMGAPSLGFLFFSLIGKVFCFFFCFCFVFLFFLEGGLGLGT